MSAAAVQQLADGGWKDVTLSAVVMSAAAVEQLADGGWKDVKLQWDY